MEIEHWRGFQGREMAEHRRLTAALGIQVFFYPPPSPWERPGGENVHGLMGVSAQGPALG
jgi:IS30 family transposase